MFAFLPKINPNESQWNCLFVICTALIKCFTTNLCLNHSDFCEEKALVIYGLSWSGWLKKFNISFLLNRRFLYGISSKRKKKKKKKTFRLTWFEKVNGKYHTKDKSKLSCESLSHSSFSFGCPLYEASSSVSFLFQTMTQWQCHWTSMFRPLMPLSPQNTKVLLISLVMK